MGHTTVQFRSVIISVVIGTALIVAALVLNSARPEVQTAQPGPEYIRATGKCAQCHSHKYDPIPQRDYYRLTAIFKGGYDEHDWLKPTIVKGQAKAKKAGRVLPFVTSAEKQAYEQTKQKLESQIAAAKSAQIGNFSPSTV